MNLKLKNHLPSYPPSATPLTVHGPSWCIGSQGYIVNGLTKTLVSFGYDARLNMLFEQRPESPHDFRRYRHLHFQGNDTPSNVLYTCTTSGLNLNLHTKKLFTYDGADSFASFTPESKRIMQSADMNFVYSSSDKAIYKSNGISNTQVLPPGLPDMHYHDALTSNPFQVVAANCDFSFRLPPDIRVFLSLGMFQQRKGISQLIEAFYKAFQGNPDVVLWLHGQLRHWGNHNDLPQFQDYMSRPGAPQMLWTNGLLTHHQLEQLICTAYRYISCSYYEGFGYMPLMCAALGVPSIVTPTGGPEDWATESNSYLVPTNRIDCPLPELPKGFPWGIWNTDDMVEALRDTRRIKDKYLHEVANQYRWENSIGVLTKLIPESRISQAPSLTTEFNKLANILTKTNSWTDILIPCHKGAADLERFLASIFLYTESELFNIIVCCEHEDNDVKSVCSKFNVSHICCPIQQDIAAARNTLLRASFAEYVFICDCDLEVIQHEWISLFKSSLRRTPTILAPKLLLPSGQIQSAGGKPRPDVDSSHRLYGTKDAIAADIACELPYAPSAAWFARRETLLRVGGFCEDYKWGFEDVHTCFLLRELGGEVRYEPKVKFIHHEHSASRSGIVMKEAFENSREVFKYYWL